MTATMFPGCEPVEPRKPSAEEQAEQERIEAACKAAKLGALEQERLEVDRALWRRQSEEAARRRAMTPAQRDAEDSDRLYRRLSEIMAVVLCDDPTSDHYIAGRRERVERLLGSPLRWPNSLAALGKYVADVEAAIDRVDAEDEAAEESERLRVMSPAQRRRYLKRKSEGDPDAA